MAVGCRGRCWRVLTLSGWIFDPKASITQMEVCPTCLAREEAARTRAYLRARRKTERLKLEPGGLDHTHTEDAFDGFRNT